nr:recombinase family protein [Rhodoblastus acidophilus]
MAGVVRDGRHAGGRAYGYRPVPAKPGELQIDEEEAAVIRDIFVSYVAGQTPREIAATLNARRVSPPRGRYWTASTLNGSLKRHNGIILNELYAGRIVWNRVRMIKDPDTGKRVSRPNPRSEWQSIDAPHLRIVEQELFAQAGVIKQERGGPIPCHTRKPKRVLSGLLKCGCCGAGMSVKDTRKGRQRIQCTQMKEAGTCDHRRAYDLDTVERTVLNGLKANLTTPDLIAAYVETYNEERKRLAAGLIANRSRIEKRLATTKREFDRIYQSYVKGFAEEADVRDTLIELKEERKRLEADLAAAEKPPESVALHPTALARYRQQVDDLQKALSADPSGDNREPINALRELVSAIMVLKTPPGAPIQVEVRGRLAALIGHQVFPAARMVGGKVVAEVRLPQIPQQITATWIA